MKIYTGYYAKLKEYKDNGLYPIGITLKPPQWFNGTNITALAPRWVYFKKPEAIYTREFFKDLAKLDPKKIYGELIRKSCGMDIVLLCYEKPGDFCHRHFVAKWLNEKMNLNIIEFGSNKTEYKQQTIF